MRINIASLKQKAVCLIPNEGKVAPSCHEYSVCDCIVLQLIRALEIQREAILNIIRDEAMNGETVDSVRCRRARKKVDELVEFEE